MAKYQPHTTHPFNRKQGIFLMSFIVLICWLYFFNGHADLLRISIYFYATMLIAILSGPLSRASFYIRFRNVFRTAVLILSLLLLYLPFVIERNWSQWNLHALPAGLAIGGFLLIVDFKGFKKAIFGVPVLLPIQTRERVMELITLVLDTIGEEILFRGVFLFILYEHFGLVSVAIVSIAFVLRHALAWRASSVYSTKAYIMQFALSVLVSFVFVFTQSLIACIITHVIFNIREICILCKRPAMISAAKQNLFNDY